VTSFVYRFATPYNPNARILYVNVIPGYSCPNSCRFCSRKDAIGGKVNIYERKAGTRLWLQKAPSVEEVMHELDMERERDTKEIAFVGLGEPLLQFELVRDIIVRIRSELGGFEGKIRIDTNGLVKCWHKGNPACELKEAGLDDIRVSVNAINRNDYVAISRSGYEHAFERLCEFVRDCIEAGIRTRVSFVVGFDDGIVKTRTKEEYLDFAITLGIRLEEVIFRDYEPPLR